ncbi:unnamed protein product [Pseudo-nitzschia multistriata]|uniref:Uncharacterized protein n=1 Tax=Pseudo-nitzschia multistriata TaxID=183589 RepID=A0A448Z5Z8_9STRA|nr:unnamed protein product [Pseudo-nitzschia multistriata]
MLNYIQNIYTSNISLRVHYRATLVDPQAPASKEGLGGLCRGACAFGCTGIPVLFHHRRRESPDRGIRALESIGSLSDRAGSVLRACVPAPLGSEPLPGAGLALPRCPRGCAPVVAALAALPAKVLVFLVVKGLLAVDAPVALALEVAPAPVPVVVFQKQKVLVVLRALGGEAAVLVPVLPLHHDALSEKALVHVVGQLIEPNNFLGHDLDGLYAVEVDPVFGLVLVQPVEVHPLLALGLLGL